MIPRFLTYRVVYGWGGTKPKPLSTQTLLVHCPWFGRLMESREFVYISQDLRWWMWCYPLQPKHISTKNVMSDTGAYPIVAVIRPVEMIKSNRFSYLELLLQIYWAFASQPITSSPPLLDSLVIVSVEDTKNRGVSKHGQLWRFPICLGFCSKPDFWPANFRSADEISRAVHPFSPKPQPERQKALTWTRRRSWAGHRRQA